MDEALLHAISAEPARENAAPEAVAPTGMPVPERLSTGVRGLYGGSFSRVRVQAARPPDGGPPGAVAGTLREQIWIDPAFHQPGTLRTNAILAHELAHVAQQQAAVGGDAAGASHESEADNAAARVLAADGARRMPRPSAGPLRLQSCTFADTPSHLASLDAAGKASVIESLQQQNAIHVDSAVYKVFESAAQNGQFVAVADELDMDAVFEKLDDWNAVRVGSLGPVVDGVDVLTAKRGAFIRDVTHDSGVGLGQVFTAFIVDTTPDDQVRAVLTWLADDTRIATTIGVMPAIRDRLKARGIEPSEYLDRKRGVGAIITRALVEGVGDALGSSPHGKEVLGGLPWKRVQEMPSPYGEAGSEILGEAFEAGMAPGNLTLGILDNVTLGIPGGIYGLGVSTGSGIWDIAHGDLDKGTRELVPALITLATLAVGRAVSGPKGGTGGVSGGGKGGPPVERIRFAKPTGGVITIESILAQFPEQVRSMALRLRGNFTDLDLVKVSQYTRETAAAAAFVERNGQKGIRALGTSNGDVGLAQTHLATLAAATTGRAGFDFDSVPADTTLPAEGTVPTTAGKAMPTEEEMEAALATAKTPVELATIVRTQVKGRRGKYGGPLPIFWPHLNGRGLPVDAPSMASSISVTRRLIRRKPAVQRDPAVAGQFRSANVVRPGQAVHHVTPLMMDGPDRVDNMAAVWISYHNAGHILLRSQRQLPPLGYSHDVVQHDGGTRYMVVLVI